jgi:hypothetical protein
MVIKKISFNHGWWYYYRIHEPKLSKLSLGFPELKKYLYNLFDNCPHDYFEVEPRSSHLRFNLSNLTINSLKNHELSKLSKIGLQINAKRFDSNHSKVQMFMLENDLNTIAIEVPLWLNYNELSNYEKIFSSTNPLTGHIDALRIENNKIWIWDYKPNAHEEKFASTQTFFYAYMLSKRTGIPLENFRCGYFDAQNTFVFNPNCCKLPRIEQEKLIFKQKLIY